MNRKSLLFCILVLILGISLLAGCGGGSNGSGGDVTPIERGPSSDYYGLEVGAKLVWKIDEAPSNLTWLATYEVIDEDPPGEFKTKWSYSDEDKIKGEFIKKFPDGFYIKIADWYIDEDTNNEEREPDYEVLAKNPIQVGFKSDEWGEALRQENVTIPIGTFKAWVFRGNDYDYDNEGEEDEIKYLNTSYYWFVPHLGIVKSTSNTTIEGDTDVIKSTTVVASV